VGMRYSAVALLATLGLSACGDPARHALGPFADPINPDGLIAVDTIIDYKTHPGAGAPRIVSREDVRLPKMVGPRNTVASVMMGFVVDTSGFVIRNSVRIGWAPGREVADAFRDWLRDAQFAPIRRGGRPLRAAYRNLVVLFPAYR
jgi:hypothetical protein